MTNEELAQRIQSGERELMPKLWEGVQRFVCKEALRWCRAWQPYRAGLEVDDLAHCGYIAMCERIGEYDPARGSFLQWLQYPLLTAFSIEVGCRTPAQQKRPENQAVSLNTPVGGDSEDITLGDTLEDPGAPLAFEAVLEGVYQDQAAVVMQKALDELPERQRRVLRGKYYENKKLREISADVGVSVSVIQQDEHRAFHVLSRKPEIRELHHGDRNLYRNTGFASWRRSGCSVQELELLRQERLARLLRG